MRPDFAACLSELLSMNAISVEQRDLAVKEAAVSPDDARRSMDRLDSLEKSKPTVGQFGRYAGIGGAAGAAAGAIGNAIEHGGALKGGTPKAKLLNVAANTAKGALAGGAVPLLRNHMDRRAEMGTLKNFMAGDKVASVALVSMFDRMRKEADIPGALRSIPRAFNAAREAVPAGVSGLKSIVPRAKAFVGHEGVGDHLHELGGLGVLAAPAVDTLQAGARARLAGDKGHDAIESRSLMGGEMGHAAAEVGGLGILMRPEYRHMMGAAAAGVAKHAFSQSAYSGNVAQNPPGSRSHSPLPSFTTPELARKEGELEPKLAGVGVGAGMSTSQYSGPLSMGAFKMVSGAPPYSEPELERKKTAKVSDNLVTGLAGAGLLGMGYLAHRGSKQRAKTRAGTASMVASVRGREGELEDAVAKDPASIYKSQAAYEKSKTASFFGELTSLVKSAFTGAALGPMHAAGKLQATSSVGAPRTTAPPGPSISEIAKPKGFGTPLAGTKKTTL